MNALRLALASLPLLAACSGASSLSGAPSLGRYETRASTSGYTASPPSPAASVTASREAAAPAQEPGGRAVDVAPSARPGLATTWGEDVASRVHYTAFERASDAPFDVATLWYNDARLAAMQAHRASERVGWVGLGPRRDGVRLSLRDDRGTPLPGFVAGGRVFVLGEEGQRYTVLLENRTAARFEALVTVDGLDVVSGAQGSYANRGYILQPFGRLEIRGFRQSLERVAAFRFGAVGDSYAAQQGDARNVGVVGVALFAERGVTFDLDDNEVELRDQANPFPGAFAPPPPRRLY